MLGFKVQNSSLDSAINIFYMCFITNLYIYLPFNPSYFLCISKLIADFQLTSPKMLQRAEHELKSNICLPLSLLFSFWVKWHRIKCTNPKSVFSELWEMHSACNSNVYQDCRTFPSLQKVLSWPFLGNPCLCSQATIVPTFFFLSRVVLLVLELYRNGLLESILFCEWLLPLSPRIFRISTPRDPDLLFSVECQCPMYNKPIGTRENVCGWENDCIERMQIISLHE